MWATTTSGHRDASSLPESTSNSHNTVFIQLRTHIKNKHFQSEESWVRVEAFNINIQHVLWLSQYSYIIGFNEVNVSYWGELTGPVAGTLGGFSAVRSGPGPLKRLRTQRAAASALTPPRPTSCWKQAKADFSQDTWARMLLRIKHLCQSPKLGSHLDWERAVMTSNPCALCWLLWWCS